MNSASDEALRVAAEPLRRTFSLLADGFIKEMLNATNSSEEAGLAFARRAEREMLKEILTLALPTSRSSDPVEIPTYRWTTLTRPGLETDF